MSFFQSGVRRGRIVAAAAAVAGLAGLTALTGPTGVPGAITAQAAVSTYNPFDVNSDFTILTTGNAHLGNAELEGSVAAFGSISSDDPNGYDVLHQSAGRADYTVPLVDGEPVRILAGTFTGTGSFDISNRDDSGTIATSSPEANAVAKLADTTGLTAQVRGGGVGNNAGGDFPRVTDPEGGFLDLKAAPYAGFAVSDLQTDQAAVADYFPDLEVDVERTNECLASMYGDPELSNAVTVEEEGGLVYVSGFPTTMPNVIDYADVAGATIKMDRADGYVPTVQAPLVIQVPEGTTAIGPLDFEGWSAGGGEQQDYARYIMLDLSAVTGTVTVDGLEMGAIWAPNATVEFASGITTNGQWFADGVTTMGGGEIHHHTFGGLLLCDDEAPGPSPSPSPSPSTPVPSPSPSAPSPSAPSPSPSPSAPSPSPSPADTPSPSSPVPSGTPTPSTSGTPGTPDGGPGSLAVTGSPAAVLAGTATAAVLLGALLIAVRRRVGR